MKNLRILTFISLLWLDLGGKFNQSQFSIIVLLLETSIYFLLHLNHRNLFDFLMKPWYQKGTYVVSFSSFPHIFSILHFSVSLLFFVLTWHITLHSSRITSIFWKSSEWEWSVFFSSCRFWHLYLIFLSHHIRWELLFSKGQSTSFLREHPVLYY